MTPAETKVPLHEDLGRYVPVTCQLPVDHRDGGGWGELRLTTIGRKSLAEARADSLGQK